MYIAGIHAGIAPTVCLENVSNSDHGILVSFMLLGTISNRESLCRLRGLARTVTGQKRKQDYAANMYFQLFLSSPRIRRDTTESSSYE